MINKIIKPGDSNFNMVPAQDVLKFHENDDVDHDHSSHHHTLGKGPNQAMPGNEGVSMWGAQLAPAESVPNNAVYRIINWGQFYSTPDVEHNGGGTGRMTIKRPGTYEIAATITFQNTSAAGVRVLQIKRNNATYAVGHAQPITGSIDHTTCIAVNFFNFVAGDVIDFFAFQNSGAAINLVTDPYTSARILRLGRF